MKKRARYNRLIRMDGPSTTLRIGDWSVDSKSGQISRSGESTRLDVRAMRLLLYLAEHVGEVVSINDLLDHVWGNVNVSQDSVYQAVTSLRRQLKDDPKNPSYIETVPRMGYRMIASVSSGQGGEAEPSSLAANTLPISQGRSAGMLLGLGLICVVLTVGYFFLFHNKPAGSDGLAIANAAPSQSSIAVLPFLDLTEGMKEEEFADGMTEELIGKISKIPGFRVPAPTSSFYFKDKQVPVPEIARTLGVAYILDGSVRKSGSTVRIAARLVRADNGYVMWAETYDRPFTDVLMVQDNIAGEVAKVLKTAIQANPAPGGMR